MTDQTLDLAQRDEGFRKLLEAWPNLSERARWEIFLMVWWFAFRSDLARLFQHLGAAVRVVVDTLKIK